MSSSSSGTPVGRRLFVLLGHESSTSAATAPWGVLGIEGPDGEGRWATWLSRLPLTEDSGQWQERLNGLAGIGRALLGVIGEEGLVFRQAFVLRAALGHRRGLRRVS